MGDYSAAFQPLLHPLDRYAIRILERSLKPRIPSDHGKRRDYFDPYLGSVTNRERVLLEKNQRYLERNLVYGQSIQKLGTLLFCLDYGQQKGWNVDGVWHDVENAFAATAWANFYQLLD